MPSFLSLSVYQPCANEILCVFSLTQSYELLL